MTNVHIVFRGANVFSTGVGRPRVVMNRHYNIEYSLMWYYKEEDPVCSNNVTTFYDISFFAKYIHGIREKKLFCTHRLLNLLSRSRSYIFGFLIYLNIENIKIKLQFALVSCSVICLDVLIGVNIK